MTRSDEPLTLAEVRRRSVAGWAALALRGGAGKLVTLAGLVVLSRALRAEDFGAFAVVQAPVGLLALAADAGLHAALVQRAELTAEDEAAGFTLRLALAAALGGLMALGAGWVAGVYRLDEAGVWALRALALGPVMNALGTVPGMRLTRDLRWGRLAWAEFGSLVAGQAAAVGLALAGARLPTGGHGLWALVGGALATTAAGTVLVNLMAPWRPRLAWPREAGRRLLRFGLPYQAQGLFHLMKDRAIPALGGLLLSGGAVGTLSWAQDLARWPRLPADYAARVGFPAFARLQGDSAALGRAVNEALRLTMWLSGGLTALGLALAPRLLTPIFGEEWAGALAPLLIFLAQTPLDALAAVLLPVIYAAGRARQGLRLSAVWAGLTWLACLGAVWAWPHLPGAMAGQAWAAVPLGFALATLAAVGLIARGAQGEVRIEWGRNVGLPLGVAGVGGVLVWLLVRG